jgi:hypothetical protein
MNNSLASVCSKLSRSNAFEKFKGADRTRLFEAMNSAFSVAARNAKTFDMYCEFLEVNKDLADALLDLSAGNRAYRNQRLDAYCRARIENRWKLTHQGICFGDDGKLYDGHHRLKFVSITGLPTTFLFVFNLPPSHAAFIDSGLPRSAMDAMKMSGLGEYTKEMCATASVIKDVHKGMAVHWSAQRMDPEQYHVVINEFAEGLTFACDMLKGAIGATRTARALVARAYYHVDTSRLEDFCLILKSGQPLRSAENPENDQAAFAYRNFLIQARGASGSAIDYDRYARGQSALKAFIERRSLAKLYKCTDDIYPIQ